MARTKGARDIGPRKNSTVGSYEKRIGMHGIFKADTCKKDGTPRKARSDANIQKYWPKDPK